MDAATPVPLRGPSRGLILRWDGTRWQRTECAGVRSFRAISFVSTTDVWATADLNGILHSADGGLTWTFVPDYFRWSLHPAALWHALKEKLL